MGDSRITEYCGKSKAQMKQVLYFLCDIEPEICLTDQEEEMFDIAIQCVGDMVNSMSDIPPCKGPIC